MPRPFRQNVSMEPLPVLDHQRDIALTRFRIVVKQVNYPLFNGCQWRSGQSRQKVPAFGFLLWGACWSRWYVPRLFRQRYREEGLLFDGQSLAPTGTPCLPETLPESVLHKASKDLRRTSYRC